MVEQKQYLSLTIAGATFLLPSAMGFTIEQRDNLQMNQVRSSHVIAWHVTRMQRAPAYALDRKFQVAHPDNWQRAVFIGADGGSVGIVVDDVYVLPKAQVASFSPLGPAPTPAGHLFSGIWVTNRELTFVLDPPALTAYLRSFGE